MMKLLKRGKYEYGIMGEDTIVPNIKVGDIVNLYVGKNIVTTLMIKDNEGNTFAMGYGATFNNRWKSYNVTKLVDHSNVTNDVLKLLGQRDFHIENVEYVEMSLHEVERKLGYKIKITS